MKTVWIGYDQREHAAWEVCRDSILRRTSEVQVRTLRQDTLRQGGFYNRESFLTSSNQRIDAIDRKPFSTDFSFTRFLVAPLSLYEGWALFCDCDFLFTASLDGLFELIDDRYAVMCVKHQHDPVEAIKMDGVLQTRYRRKNWSSLVLWNAAHPSNRHISIECVNRMPGAWLHAFEWLKDEEIGEIPLTWNWLSGVSEPLDEVPSGVHFTIGGPWFENCQNVPYADLWRTERDSMRALSGVSLPSERLQIVKAA